MASIILPRNFSGLAIEFWPNYLKQFDDNPG